MGHILLKIKKSLFFFILIKICFTDIICTTTIISSVIKDLTENKIKVTTVVSSGICPGHADIRIADLKVIEKDKVLFAHGFEPYLEKIKKTIKNSNLKIVIIETKGNLLIPENQKILYEKIKDELIKIYPDYEKLLQKNLNKKKEEIDNVDIEIKSKLEKYKG
ncbi:MAG: zinc ABC transporter substrate-binding protein, partial [bacterium]|nr:zinc ABC transporter substrate-binding protein [bacterium]MDW8163501.1 zinc ABC transporter substrate-binding protein [Candidatus Omnitrophota bacterium]